MALAGGCGCPVSSISSDCLDGTTRAAPWAKQCCFVLPHLLGGTAVRAVKVLGLLGPAEHILAVGSEQVGVEWAKPFVGHGTAEQQVVRAEW